MRLLPSRWLPLGWILRELRLLRKAQERIAVAMELANAHQWPQQIQRDPLTPVVEVSYVDDAQQELLMDIEARLTAARGQPPTEEEILIEYERRSPTPTASPSPYGDT